MNVAPQCVDWGPQSMTVAPSVLRPPSHLDWGPSNGEKQRLELGEGRGGGAERERESEVGGRGCGWGRGKRVREREGVWSGAGRDGAQEPGVGADEEDAFAAPRS